jgi:hypothetical protein
MSIESIEGWIQRWKLVKVFYDWQTLIAGVLALLAGFGTVWMTRHIANSQIKATFKQIETTVRLERLRRAHEDFAFYAMFESAMDRVLAEEAAVPQTGLGVYAVRPRFSKMAFDELRGACLTHGSRLTEKFLELETKINDFALRTNPLNSAIPVSTAELDPIKSLTKQLGEGARLGQQQARLIVEAETVQTPPPPKRPWWRRLVSG